MDDGMEVFVGGLEHLRTWRHEHIKISNTRKETQKTKNKKTHEEQEPSKNTIP